ncbi:peptidoglycan DD-metalloendopeptidase family protein [Acaricomes phytoseiuli]|uniref:M23 family metallopeptidase n=1 Tax=Acaricomes phytoseiuli TaxID=291968 RepID=UPI000378AB1B|nr:M23 family metallopeptidase [Acaricomes phytoseiuli]MCW1249396.1 peptidoglycan DD-metalloendopeptidase family protein [Acaricomes phytoseiuli]
MSEQPSQTSAVATAAEARGSSFRRHRTTILRSCCVALSTGLFAGIAAPLFLGAAANAADQLDDQAAKLQQQAADVQASLEFVDTGIAKSAADLTLYSGMLPGARQALSDAQGKVATATSEAQSLSERLGLAQQSKDKIAEQIASDQVKSEESQKIIGQIAAQTYKSGGLPANLSVLLSADPTEAVDSTALADQALRSQYAILDKLSQQGATNRNAQARLVAVETEIQDLKGKADAALVAEQTAQEEAAGKKADLEKLVSDTTALSEELNAKRPEIQAQLASVQAQQQEVAAQIAERQRKEQEAWQAEQRRLAEARGQSNYVPPQPGTVEVQPSSFGLVSPFAGFPVTSGWGWRQVPPGTIDFYGTGAYQHTGIDYGAPCGTPVRAPAAGTVSVAGWLNNGGGNAVQLSNGVVQGNALTTVFYHNSRVVVSAGQQVNTGDVLAYSGSTGNSTGCHAHFETWLNGTPVNPAGLL